jgi:hypothetical protein
MAQHASHAQLSTRPCVLRAAAQRLVVRLHTQPKCSPAASLGHYLPRSCCAAVTPIVYKRFELRKAPSGAKEIVAVT